jgi:ferric-dicitrate binding protein FerR (iron transport regulator)
MAANQGKEEPPLTRKAAKAAKAAIGRRRRRRRESALVWWGVFAALVVAAWWLRSWRLALLTLLLWCLYELVLVPTICRVTTRQGFSCREPARGRLFACKPGHQQVKNDALWRLAGLRNPFRKAPETDPHRETGTLLVSPVVRGRLAQADRALILLAAAGTLITIVGMIYGFDV